MEAQAEATWPPPPPFFRDGHLQPPPPVEGEFSMYGVMRSSKPQPPAALEVLLYDPNAPRCSELRKLNRSLLRAFMELLQVMVLSPGDIDVKVAELRNLLLNMQHLLNSFRVHKARAELIAILQKQVDLRRNLINQLKAVQDQAADVANGVAGCHIGRQAELDGMVLPTPPNNTADKGVMCSMSPCCEKSTLDRLIAVLDGVPLPGSGTSYDQDVAMDMQD